MGVYGVAAIEFTGQMVHRAAHPAAARGSQLGVLQQQRAAGAFNAVQAVTPAVSSLLNCKATFERS